MYFPCKNGMRLKHAETCWWSTVLSLMILWPVVEPLFSMTANAAVDISLVRSRVDELAVSLNKVVVQYAFVLDLALQARRAIDYLPGEATVSALQIECEQAYHKVMGFDLDIDSLKADYQYYRHFSQGSQYGSPRWKPMPGNETLRWWQEEGGGQRVEKAIGDCGALVGGMEGLQKSLEGLLDRLQKLESVQKASPWFAPRPVYPKPENFSIGPDGKPSRLVFGLVNADKRFVALEFDYAFDPHFGHEMVQWKNEKEPYFDEEYYKKRYAATVQSGYPFEVAGHCPFDDYMPCPQWLKEKAKVEPTLYKAGKFEEFDWCGGKYAKLNFMHPVVQEMVRGYLGCLGRHFVNDPKFLFYRPVWEPKEGRSTTNPAINSEFQKYLQQKHGTIETLNQCWGSSYKSFAEIAPTPGKDPSKSTGLFYDFEIFWRQGFVQHLRLCYDTLKANDPKHAVAIDPCLGIFTWWLNCGLDFPQMMDACDIFSYHMHNTRFDENYLASINRYKKKTLASLEFYWNDPDGREARPEHEMKAIMERSTWLKVANDCRIFCFFGGRDTFLGEPARKPVSYNYLYEFDVDYSTLRRCAGHLPVLKRKLNAVYPELASSELLRTGIMMLQPTASMISGPTGNGPYLAAERLAGLLEARNIQYAVVTEEFILGGQENLADCSVLLLPLATHLPKGLSEKLLEWVKNGGWIVASGFFDLADPYGKDTRQMLREIFGNLEVKKYDVNLLAWETELKDAKPACKTLQPGILYAEYGKGRVWMSSGDIFHRNEDSSSPVAPQRNLKTDGAEALFYEVLSQKYHPPVCLAENKTMCILRQGKDRLYCILINPDYLREAKDTLKIANAKPGLQIIDWGIPGGFPVTPSLKDGEAQIPVRLPPGGGTLIQIKH